MTYFDKLMTLKQRLLVLWLRHNGIVVASDIEIGRFTFIDTLYPGVLFIGKRCTLARGAMILTHDSTRLNPTGGLTGITRIGDFVFIGVGAVIMPGVTLGNHCIIGANSVVTHDIPAWHVAAGNPARVLREVR